MQYLFLKEIAVSDKQKYYIQSTENEEEFVDIFAIVGLV